MFTVITYSALMGNVANSMVVKVASIFTSRSNTMVETKLNEKK
jgi:hypothetical protein